MSSFRRSAFRIVLTVLLAVLAITPESYVEKQQMPTVESQSFANDGSAWTGSGHVEPNGSDPNYPLMWVAEHTKIVAGAGPAGQNVLEAFSSDVTIAGVWFHGASWNLSEFDITVLVKPTADGLDPASFNYAIIFQLMGGLSNHVFTLSYDVLTEQLELGSLGGYDNLATLPLSAASIEDTWQTFRFCGKMSEDNGFGAQDGELKVYRNGTEIFSHTGIWLYTDGPTVNVPGYRLGFYGLLGQYTGVSIKDTACTAAPVDPPDIVDNSDPCCATSSKASTAGNGGGQGNGADPVAIPLIGAQIECAGGGTVPIQVDIPHSEVWWGV